jgi:hypothetical protein
MVINLVSQLEQQQTPSFDRQAFQVSQPSDNTVSSTVRSAVLKTKPRTEGFNRGAWEPPG